MRIGYSQTAGKTVGAKRATNALAKAPPADYFLYLYRAVGAEYEWTDWLARPVAEAEAFVRDPTVSLRTMLLDGWPGGFFMFDTRADGVCDLAYFGLVPQAIGRGLGPWLLAGAQYRGLANDEWRSRHHAHARRLEHLDRLSGTYRLKDLVTAFCR